ncbi:HAD family hydrolase [Kitasatospora aureofaciens]|uniref:Haloacid dehalogenase n=1 Tax=Kitasatospora aureofaciens TaxID=1894 RepID=A0A1E7N5H7_KITAU|nr:HAD family hydrolase [Kitasatospora aureofaciens]ARF80914.1 haloacid dehalogenase [Kitasatospora aureofaciens]OEV35713.1 haloacid dehalogenase [Kitasatospora aureofaciens]GGU63059.1 hydrolase [Kitasatospora aureofaciens]
MIEPIELVIFDCDGVLVDSEVIAVRVLVQLGEEFGWPLTEAEAIERFVGRSEAANHAMVAERFDEETATLFDKRFRELHAEAVDAGLTPVDGLPEVLDALETLALPTCVASSGTHEKMRHTLGRTGLYGRFEGRIFSATEVGRGKPAPDLFLHAARRMGVDPARCLVVEDSGPGVQAARAAGMRALGYAGGVTAAERLAGPGTVVFDDMRELPGLIAAYQG